MVDLKPIKKAVQGSSMLVRRWAVLGALVLAVGAVAVWGGLSQKQEEPQGAAGLLMEQLQAHIGADADGETVLQPVSGVGVFDSSDAGSGSGLGSEDDDEESSEKSSEKSNEEFNEEFDEKITGAEQAAVKAADGLNKDLESDLGAETNLDNEPQSAATASLAEGAPPDDEEVYDYAPDPWLADAALSAEAKLLKMLDPVSGGVCSRGFGYNFDPTFRDYRFHGGLDIEAAPGTAVICPLGAEVSSIEDDGFGGQVIILEHGDKLVSRLEGLVPAADLKAGDKLSAGDKLGEIGDPPLLEDAQLAHLHWELLLDGEPVDASAYGYGE